MEQHLKLKVRLGVGIGQWPFGPPEAQPFWRFVGRAEELGIDSIWISDRVVSDRLSLDPITAFAAIAGRTRTIKFGPSVLALPLRHPVVLAKEIATIDFLSGGRMLPAVGIGTELPEELLACGVKREERAGRTDEAIQLMRRLWLEEKVTHKGRYFQVENATVLPRPVRKPPPIWIGGRTEAAFRRTGALGDGWLAAQVTPEEAATGIEQVQHYASQHNRRVPIDHFGVIIPYCLGRTPEAAADEAGPRMPRQRADLRLADYCGLGTPDDVCRLIDRYIAVGVSKFVLRPACQPERFFQHLDALGQEMAPRYHRP